MKQKFAILLLATTAVAVMLLLCLAEMPYGYYELVRYVSAVFFAYMAYESFERGKKRAMFLFVALALLFQPFMKIALGRTLWNVIDVVVALGLIAMLVKGRGGNK